MVSQYHFIWDSFCNPTILPMSCAMSVTLLDHVPPQDQTNVLCTVYIILIYQMLSLISFNFVVYIYLCRTYFEQPPVLHTKKVWIRQALAQVNSCRAKSVNCHYRPPFRWLRPSKWCLLKVISNKGDHSKQVLLYQKCTLPVGRIYWKHCAEYSSLLPVILPDFFVCSSATYTA